MMKILILTGGFIDDKFTLDYLKSEKYDKVIAVDSGLNFCYRAKILPDIIVGDYDSVEEGVLEFFAGKNAKNKMSIEIVRLNPEKDDTDTGHALQMALDMGATCIHIFGGTGSRLDHVLGNIQLLGYALGKNVECLMLDVHNRIRLINGDVVLKKKEQFGKYVSLIPFTENVTGLTLTGFKYPLENYTMTSFYQEGASFVSGVSNEIVEEEAWIHVENGVLILVEARD